MVHAESFSKSQANKPIYSNYLSNMIIRMRSLALAAGTALIVATYAVGAIAKTYNVIYPEHHIEAAQQTVQFDVSSMEPGDMSGVSFNGDPVWIYRRTDADLEYLDSLDRKGLNPAQIDTMVKGIKRRAATTSAMLNARLQLQDQPALEASPYRSKTREYFVFVPIGVYGCLLQREFYGPIHIREGTMLVDTCHSHQYDVAGVAVGSNAVTYPVFTTSGQKQDASTSFPVRLRIPPHEFISDDTLVVGVADIDELPNIELVKEDIYGELTPAATLRTATAYGDIEMAQQAIKNGASAMTEISLGTTKTNLALSNAVDFGPYELVELLVREGARPNQWDIESAARHQRTDVLELFEQFPPIRGD